MFHVPAQWMRIVVVKTKILTEIQMLYNKEVFEIFYLLGFFYISTRTLDEANLEEKNTGFMVQANSITVDFKEISKVGH